MPEETTTIRCGNCHREQHGIYSSNTGQSMKVGMFYRVTSGEYHRYAREGESYLCARCLRVRIREQLEEFKP